MYIALGLASNQVLLVQGIYGAIGPIVNFLCVVISYLLRSKQCLIFAFLASLYSPLTLSDEDVPSCLEQAHL
jgi:hypothetical protein